MCELEGGQLWVQEDLPNMRCLLVCMGADCWSTIQPPLDGPGCIVRTNEDHANLFTTKQMLAQFRKHNYTLKGQYYDVVMKQFFPSVTDPVT